MGDAHPLRWSVIRRHQVGGDSLGGQLEVALEAEGMDEKAQTNAGGIQAP